MYLETVTVSIYLRKNEAKLYYVNINFLKCVTQINLFVINGRKLVCLCPKNKNTFNIQQYVTKLIQPFTI